MKIYRFKWSLEAWCLLLLVAPLQNGPKTHGRGQVSGTCQALKESKPVVLRVVRFFVWARSKIFPAKGWHDPMTYMDVSKNRGVSHKMDGENNGKPDFLMDDLGGKPTIFGT